MGNHQINILSAYFVKVYSCCILQNVIFMHPQISVVKFSFHSTSFFFFFNASLTVMSKWVAFVPVWRDIMYSEARQIYPTNILYAPLLCNIRSPEVCRCVSDIPTHFWLGHFQKAASHPYKNIPGSYEWANRPDISRSYEWWMSNISSGGFSFVLPVYPDIASIDLKLYRLTFPHDC